MQISNEQKEKLKKDWEITLGELLDELGIPKDKKEKILKKKAKLYEFLKHTENLSFFGIDIENE